MLKDGSGAFAALVSDATTFMKGRCRTYRYVELLAILINFEDELVQDG